jgi:hypothetical protein
MKRLAAALCGLILSTSVQALDIKASPKIINYGGVTGVTVNGAPGKPGDWIGIFTYQAPDANPWVWVKAEASSFTWVLPAYLPVSTCYDFRLFSQWSFTRLGSSNCVWVQDPNAPVQTPDPVPQPQPDPKPQTDPHGAVVYDLTNATWYPGPTIGGRNYSVNASPFQRVLTWSPSTEVDYVTTGVSGALPYGGKLVMRFRLSGGPLRGTVEPTAISVVSLHMQRPGDDWQAGPVTQWYRGWTHAAAILNNVPDGEFEIVADLEPNSWTGVWTAPHADFGNLLANANVIGFTFGDAGSKGHGNVCPQGGCRLEVLEFTVRRP